MRLLFISDLHLDAITGGHDRWPELQQYFREVDHAIDEYQIDILGFVGDAFDPGTAQEARWHTELLGWAYRLTSKLEATVWIAGNHDVLEMAIGDDAEPCTVLSPLARLAEEAAEDPNGMRSDVLARMHVAETPRLLTFDFVPTRREGAARERLGIVALPYMARAVHRADPDAYTVAIDAAKHLSADGVPIVVLSHLMLSGMVPGSEDEMLRGRDIPLPIKELEELAPALVANGHYHRREVVRRGNVDIQIVGAPVHMTFGERNDGARGFLIVEV